MTIWKNSLRNYLFIIGIMLLRHITVNISLYITISLVLFNQHQHSSPNLALFQRVHRWTWFAVKIIRKLVHVGKCTLIVKSGFITKVLLFIILPVFWIYPVNEPHLAHSSLERAVFSLSTKHWLRWSKTIVFGYKQVLEEVFLLHVLRSMLL